MSRDENDDSIRRDPWFQPVTDQILQLLIDAAENRSAGPGSPTPPAEPPTTSRTTRRQIHPNPTKRRLHPFFPVHASSPSPLSRAAQPTAEARPADALACAVLMGGGADAIASRKRPERKLILKRNAPSEPTPAS